MNKLEPISRRVFLQGSATAAPAFTLVKPELVRGAGEEELKAGLVGCGGRSTYVLPHMFRGTKNLKIVAAADLYQDNMERCLSKLGSQFPDRVAVDRENRFLGWDAYKKVLASDIDVVFLIVPPVFRPVQFEAAVEAGKHVFAEKPLGVDPVGIRRLMAAARKSRERKLTVGIGAQRRSAPNYIETIEKIRSGAIGEVLATYAFWLDNPVVKLPKRGPGMGDVEYQLRNWYSYLWPSGDQVVEQHVHNIDVINWVMGAHPVKVTSSGGVAWRPRTEAHGNIYDHLTSHFEYANGVVLSSRCRHYPEGAAGDVGELVVGSSGKSNCHDMVPQPEIPSTVQQFTNLTASIRGDGPYVNNAMAVAESTMTAVMARESAYSGLEITWDQIMKSERSLLPDGIENDPELGIPPPAKPDTYSFV